MDGVGSRELDRAVPVFYRDVRGVTHACEVQGDAPGELFVRTLCNRDVPPKRVFTSDSSLGVTCEECALRQSRIAG
ncbi:MAG: hypothetical protein ACM30I_14020 [Gemmatimonas sp.]